MALGTPPTGTTRCRGGARVSLCVLGGLAISALAGCPRNTSEPQPSSSVPTVVATTGTAPSAGPSTASSTGPAPVESAAPGASSARWLGTWVSDSCAERSYQRRITVVDGGEVRGEERVSPCPPKVACVWSGIVPWRGSWRLEGDRIRFDIEPLNSAPGAIAPPSELSWDTAAAGPAELSGGCSYHRPSATP